MNSHPKRPKYANMHGKVSIFGVVKSSNVYLQSLRSVTSLYKNMHLHGNPGSSYDLMWAHGTESSKYYARPQTAAARGLGLPTRGLAGHHTDGASKHSLCYFSSFSK